jgi:organic radical activating enzyme
MSNTNSGDYRACCDSFGFGPNIQTDDAEAVWNSEFYQQLRTDLISGVQNKNCSSCWKAERNGGYSMRKNENRHYSEEAIQQIIEEKPLPKLFDFKLGNLCNLKCIMCCQLSSSLHETEVKQWKAKHIELPKLLDWIEIEFKDENQQYRIDKENCDLILNNLKSVLPNLTTLRLVGGEPLINPLTYILVDKLIEQGHATDLNLEIITNLSDIKTTFIKQLEKFKSVQLTCSYDHVDPDKFHFIRFPADYNEFKQNFDFVMGSKLNVSISTTFSIFNIFDLEQIMDEFETIGVHVSFNYVIDPNYFSIKYLNEKQKMTVMQIVNRVINKGYKILETNDSLANYLKNIDTLLHTEQNDFAEVVAERSRVLELYDSTRKTNYSKLYDNI